MIWNALDARKWVISLRIARKSKIFKALPLLGEDPGLDLTIDSDAGTTEAAEAAPVAMGTETEEIAEDTLTPGPLLEARAETREAEEGLTPETREEEVQAMIERETEVLLLIRLDAVQSQVLRNHLEER